MFAIRICTSSDDPCCTIIFFFFCIFLTFIIRKKNGKICNKNYKNKVNYKSIRINNKIILKRNILKKIKDKKTILKWTFRMKKKRKEKLRKITRYSIGL